MSPLFLLLPILLPILGGFLLIPWDPSSSKVRNCYAMAVVCLTSILVWTALLTVGPAIGPESIEVYSFTKGFSIRFGLDSLAMMFALLVSVMWPLVMLYAFDYMEHEEQANGFFGFYVMTYGITLGLAFASNMTTIYVFIEMLTLVTIPLVTFYSNHDSMYAGRKYAAYTIGGASLGLFAVVVASLYGDAGNFAYGGILSGPYNPTVLQTAFLFGFFGFGVKAAVFPLHGWLPSASVAPTPVTALLHAVAVVNSGVFSIIRLTWYVYGPDFLRGTLCLKVAQAFVIFTLVYAAAAAVKERHFKRRLAYSTVANLSYMLFGILLMTPEGLEAGMLHMLFHSVIKITLFMCAGAFMHSTGNSYVYEVNGIGRRMPVTFIMYTCCALSLTGIPGLCGFVSKLHLIMSGLAEGSILAFIGSAALMCAAFLCAMYTLTVSARAFFPMEGSSLYEEEGSAHEAHLMMLIPICAFTLINVVCGLYPAPLIGLIDRIARGLM